VAGRRLTQPRPSAAAIDREEVSMPTANLSDSSSSNSTDEVQFFTDEQAFREIIRFIDDEGTVPAEILLADIADGKVINIDKRTQLRVLEKVEGGAKVTVTSGPLDGKVGFMFAADLPKQPPRQKPFGKKQ
jgi:hypothetical protein